MASGYSARSQFLRQGGVVAAVEGQGRRVDPEVAVLVHRVGDGGLPVPPSTYLSLFAYACLGAGNAGGAAAKMSAVAEGAGAATAIRKAFDTGGSYFAPPGQYLDRFLEAAGRHLGGWGRGTGRGGRHYLERAAVGEMRHRGCGFRETRITRELRRRTGLPQPARYGRARVPVFVLPEGG